MVTVEEKAIDQELDNITKNFTKEQERYLIWAAYGILLSGMDSNADNKSDK